MRVVMERFPTGRTVVHVRRMWRKARARAKSDVKRQKAIFGKTTFGALGSKSLEAQSLGGIVDQGMLLPPEDAKAMAPTREAMLAMKESERGAAKKEEGGYAWLKDQESNEELLEF